MMKSLRTAMSFVLGFLMAALVAGCNDPKRTYISMTTSPDRISSIDVLLEELRDYILSDEISKVYIHLPRQYRNRDAYPAEKIRELKELFRRSKKDTEEPGFDGKVEFNEIELDFGPMTKIAPAKEKICNQPDNKKAKVCSPQAKPSDDVFVISIDDDYTYQQEYLNKLVERIKADENSAVSAVAYKTGNIKNWGIKRGTPGQKFPDVRNSVDMIEGWGSIIYRVRDIDDELMKRLSQVSLECRLSDDLVISYVMGINQKLRKGGRPGRRLGPLTDVGALSAGSGLELWYNAAAWDAFKQFALTTPDVGGIVKKVQGHLVLKHDEMQTKPFAPTDLVLEEVQGLEPKRNVKVFGHPKVGYVGQDAARALIARVEAEYPEVVAASMAGAMVPAGNPYKKRFDGFLERSQMKIDGFKYSRCLRTLNQCSYDGAGILKSRERILSDCRPEVQVELPDDMPFGGDVRIEVLGDDAAGLLLPGIRSRGDQQRARLGKI